MAHGTTTMASLGKSGGLAVLLLLGVMAANVAAKRMAPQDMRAEGRELQSANIGFAPFVTTAPTWGAVTDKAKNETAAFSVSSLDDSSLDYSDPAFAFPNPPFMVGLSADMDIDEIYSAMDQLDSKRIAYSTLIPSDTAATDSETDSFVISGLAAANSAFTTSGTASYGNVPRYSKWWGIIVKDPASGRWKTWINKSLSWWGADDWATGYRSCRFTRPHATLGFNCTHDATCPGCPYCRGEGCFYNRNPYTYRNGQSGARRHPGYVYAQSLMDAALTPKMYGVCANAGTPQDVGCV